MRNSVVLIDTNILLNYITNREDPYLEQSVEIVRKCAIGECTGYIAFHTLSTLWYVLRKRSDSVRRQNLKDICEIFTVATASQAEIIDALKKIPSRISRIACRINVQRMSELITLSPAM